MSRCDVQSRNQRRSATPKDNEQTRGLTYGEQEKYLAKATVVLWDVATMMFETGMRPEECTESSHRMVICLRAIYSTPMGRPRPRGVVSNSHPTQEHQTKAMNKMELFVAEQRVAFAERAASSILGLFSDFGVGVTTYPTTVHGKPSGLMV